MYEIPYQVGDEIERNEIESRTGRDNIRSWMTQIHICQWNDIRFNLTLGEPRLNPPTISRDKSDRENQQFCRRDSAMEGICP